MSASILSFPSGSHSQLDSQFLDLLPRLQNYARIVFRDVRCPARKDDKVAETVALAWQWYIRLAERGKDVSQFPMTFIFTVARAVKCGRRVTGQEKAKEVLSPLAQQRHSFRVEALPISTRTRHEDLYGRIDGQRHLDAYEERLQDNTITPVPDQVCFRLDFPAWLETLTARERRIIQAMAQNERTGALSKQFEVSPGRISQLRREFHQSWRRYCDDDAEQCITVSAAC